MSIYYSSNVRNHLQKKCRGDLARLHVLLRLNRPLYVATAFVALLHFIHYSYRPTILHILIHSFIVNDIGILTSNRIVIEALENATCFAL